MSPLGGDADALGAAVPVLASRVNGCELWFFFWFAFSFYIRAEQGGREGRGGEAMCGGYE